MALRELARDLLSKVDAFVDQTTSNDSDLFRLREEIRASAKGIAAAIDGPEQAMRAITRGYTSCTALEICLDLDLAQHMQQIEPCTIEELASSSGCDWRVLRPVLRLLMQSGIFHQMPDGRWQHTEMSAVMIRPPFRAWMTSILEEKYRATAHLPRFLKQTGYHFPVPGNTAYNDVYSTSLDFYTYSNEFNHGRALSYAISMEELARDQLPFLESSYPFERIDPRARFVDVAGGFGNLSYFLAEKHPTATFVVQDHPFIVEQAQKACPAHLKGRLRFEAHDMMSPQPQIDRSDMSSVVFLLKIILHDHGDQDSKLILGNLLAAMIEGDRILIIDTVLPEVGGSLSSCTSDMIILAMFGCGHRTLREWTALITACGEDLKIESFAGGIKEFDGMMVIEVQKKSPSV